MYTYYDPYTTLYHFGIKGQKWGVRRYQNYDGTLTPAGKRRYSILEKWSYAGTRDAITKKLYENITKSNKMSTGVYYDAVTELLNEEIQPLKEQARFMYRSGMNAESKEDATFFLMKMKDIRNQIISITSGKKFTRLFNEAAIKDIGFDKHINVNRALDYFEEKGWKM